MCVQCYNNIELAKKAEQQSADYIALGRFYPSNSKPLAAPASLDTLEKAKHEWSTWHHYEISERSSILKQFCTELIKTEPDLETVVDTWFLAIESMKRKLKTPFQLPGPSGENNILVYESRGVVVAIGYEECSLSDWFTVVISALMTGNTVVVASPDTDNHVLAVMKKSISLTKMPKHCLQFIADTSVTSLVNHKLVSAVISPLHNNQLKQLLSLRDGPIIPLLCVDELFIENRLSLEKTVSTDTTAAIGNTLLLSQRKSSISGMIA